MKFRGRVIEGQKLARELGAPTANLSMPQHPKVRDGVWMVRVRFDGNEYGGLMHVGARPTVDNQWSLEVHILKFSGDLLGKVLEVETVSFLREIVKFDSIANLAAQIKYDIVLARKFFIREQVRLTWGMTSEEERQRMAATAFGKVTESEEFQEAKMVYVYAPDPFEIHFVQEMCTRFSGKTYAFPKVEGKKMKFFVAKFEELKVGKFNILEPLMEQPAPNADLIIVPAVAAAKTGERLGRGGGFYDQFLCSISAPTICVMPEFARVDDLPVEGHDVRADRVIFV